MNSWSDQHRNSPTPNGGSDANEAALFAPLKNMDKNQLQRLLDDNDKILEMANDGSVIKGIIDEKRNIVAANKRLAEANVASEPPLIEAKAQLVQLHKDVQEARNNYNSLKGQIDSMSDKNSAGTVLALLQAATAEIEDTSEETQSAKQDKSFL